MSMRRRRRSHGACVGVGSLASEWCTRSRYNVKRETVIMICEVQETMTLFFVCRKIFVDFFRLEDLEC
jgi:hypothetical protein